MYLFSCYPLYFSTLTYLLCDSPSILRVNSCHHSIDIIVLPLSYELHCFLCTVSLFRYTDTFTSPEDYTLFKVPNKNNNVCLFYVFYRFFTKLQWTLFYVCPHIRTVCSIILVTSIIINIA